MWLERTSYWTSSSLPGILRWFEVARSETREIAPIEYACEIVSAKNNELREMSADPCTVHPVLKLTQSLQVLQTKGHPLMTSLYEELIPTYIHSIAFNLLLSVKFRDPKPLFFWVKRRHFGCNKGIFLGLFQKHLCVSVPPNFFLC